MKWIKKVVFIVALAILFSFSYSYAQDSNPDCSETDIEQVKLSPTEIKTLNDQAEKDLNALVKTYGYQLKNDVLGVGTLPKRSKDVSFEKLDGILNNFSVEKDAAIKLLTKIFNLFPNKWTLDMEIVFEDRDKKLQNTTLENKLVWGEESFDGEKKKFIICIYKSALTAYKNSEMLDDTISHELAHANDWRSNKELDTWEKVEFFKSVVTRYNAKDRYHDAWADEYIGNINFDSKEATAYNQIIEYWAIIVGVYISKDSTKLPEADKALVQSILNRTNSGFEQIKQKASLRQGSWECVLSKPKVEDHELNIIKEGSKTIYILDGGTVTVESPSQSTSHPTK